MNFQREKDSEIHENRQEQYETNSEDAAFNNTELTNRELEVLQLVEQGKTNTHISELLNISGRTVRGHLEHIMRKLHVENRTEAVFIAKKKGILKLPEI